MEIPVNTLLNANLSFTAAPALSFVTATGKERSVPGAPEEGNGFAFDLDIALPYEGLSRVLNTFLRRKPLTLSEGFIRQQVLLEGGKIYPDLQGRLVAEVPFSGSYSGTIFIIGLPVFNPQSHQIELQQVSYDLKTSSLLLKGAKWLFGNLVLEEIKKRSIVNLAPLYSAAAARIAELLNKPWGKGVHASGSVEALAITHLAAQKQQLLLRLRCTGRLKLMVTEAALPF